MAQDSKMKRKLRRFKNQTRLAVKMAEIAMDQRDFARIIANSLMKELDAKNKPKGSVTITRNVEDIEKRTDSIPVSEVPQMGGQPDPHVQES